MAEETKETDVLDTIVSVTVSLDQKVSDGNYGSNGIFISANAIVPRHGDPNKIVEGLKVWVRSHMDTKKAEDEKVLEQKQDQKKDVSIAPVCKFHNVSMKPSKYPKPGAEWYCPHKDNGGAYCKEKM